MLLIQLMGIIVFSLLIIATLILWHRKELSVSAMLIWVAIWLFLLLFVLFPNFSIEIASFVGVGRGVDLVIYVFIVLLLISNLYFFIKLEELDRELTRLVRIIALKDLKKRKKKK